MPAIAKILSSAQSLNFSKESINILENELIGNNKIISNKNISKKSIEFNKKIELQNIFS